MLFSHPHVVLCFHSALVYSDHVCQAKKKISIRKHKSIIFVVHMTNQSLLKRWDSFVNRIMIIHRGSRSQVKNLKGTSKVILTEVSVLDELYTVYTVKNNLLEIKPWVTCDFDLFLINFFLPLISLHPFLSEFLFLFTFQSPTPLIFFLMWCLHTILPKLSFSLILSLSARIFLSPSTPALESESSSLPTVHLPHHFRPGMASWSSAPPPLHVSQSDTAMLRKSVSFSEELLLAASGRTHSPLPLWPLTLGAGIASSVTTPTAVLPPGRITCLSLICPHFPQMHSECLW